MRGLLSNIKHMGHSAFSQTLKWRKVAFNYTYLLIANVGQIINVLHNKTRDRST